MTNCDAHRNMMMVCQATDVSKRCIDRLFVRFCNTNTVPKDRLFMAIVPMVYPLFDHLVDIPPQRGWDISQDEYFVVFWFVIVLLVSSCFKLVFDAIATQLIFSFLILFGWICGRIVTGIDSGVRSSEYMDRVVEQCLPLLFFHVTFKIDYHTLANSIGLILLVAIPLVFYHYLLISLITYSLLNDIFTWSPSITWLFAVGVGIIQVEYCVTELGKVQGQTRVLQLLLQGERFLSYAVGSIIHSTIIVFYNPNEPRIYDYFPFYTIVGWTLLAVVKGVIVAFIFKYAIKYFYRDALAQVTLFLSAIYMLHWLTLALHGNGLLAVMSFGIASGYLKIKYSSASERFFDKFWSVLRHFTLSLMYTSVGFFLGYKPHLHIPELVGYVLLIYILLFLARVFGFMTAFPFLSRLGYQINLKHFVIATIGVNRSSSALMLAYLDRHFTHGYVLLEVCTIVALLSMWLNVALLRRHLTVLDMYELSRSRIVNMNVAMAQIGECREKTMRALKMDRLIADSNWKIVDRVTQLEHPYSYTIDKTRVDQSTRAVKSYRVLLCRECSTENEIPPTEAEYELMKLEAKQRVLKAQLVCFWKQYETGTLSRQGVTVLNNLIEGASVKDDPRLAYKDLHIQREGTATLRFLKLIFGNLFTITSITHRFIPTNVIRATCFRLCTLRSYQIIFAFLSLIDTIITIAMLRLYYMNNDHKNQNDASLFFQSCDVLFFLIFICDFVISILGIGVVQYFCTHVNKIEFAAGLMIRGNQLAMYIHTCHVHNSVYNVFLASEAIFVQKTVMLLRVARVYVFIVALIPRIMVLIDRKLDQDLIRSYDIGKAYLISLNRVGYYLNHIAENDRVFNELMEAVETDRMYVSKELGLIQKDRPTIGISNKTHHAIRHVIMVMADCVSNMKDEGLLDPAESRSLTSSLEKVKRRLLVFPLVQPTPPDLILYSLPWLCDDLATTLFLQKHARLTSFMANERIIYHKEEPVGLYILVSGMVRVSYLSSPEVYQSAHQHGMLPNCDYFTNLKFAQSQTELVMSGNPLGEVGVVTNRTYDMEVVSETRVQLYYIPLKIMKVVTETSGNSAFIEAKIWKSVGIKLAVHLLHNTARFQGWQDYKIRLYLQRGVVPNLKDVESIHIGDFVDDVILIQGKLMDAAVRSVYVAPCIIPRVSSRRLILPGTTGWDASTHCTTRILIIPNSETDLEEIMSHEGLFKFSTQDTVAKKTDTCPQQTSHDYAARLHQSQRQRKMATQFMDYMPALSGARDGLPVSTTYIEKFDRSYPVKPGLHHITRYIFNMADTNYTQDIEEQSEIEQLKDDIEDYEDAEHSGRRQSRHRSSSRFGKKNRKHLSSSSMTDDRDSSIYQSYIRDDAREAEILVIEDSSDDGDLENSKAVQTRLTRIFRRSPPNAKP